MKVLITAIVFTFSFALAAQDHENVGRICREDVRTLCPDVQPGGGSIYNCLKENRTSIQDPKCKKLISKIRDRRDE